MLGVAHKCNKSSWGQEDIVPDEPLKEAVMGLWYNDLVPKPNIKVIFIQTTLILLTDCSRHPYGMLQPLPNPVADVFRGVDIHGGVWGLCVPDSVVVAAKHPTLLGGAICCRGVAGNGSYLHEPRVCGLTLVIPLQGMD